MILKNHASAPVTKKDSRARREFRRSKIAHESRRPESKALEENIRYIDLRPTS